MSIASAIVLFAVFWFLIFLIVIPIRLQTQADVGKVVPGTHSASPEVHNLGRKALITTGITAVLWAIAVAVILSGKISVRDLDLFDRMGPAPATDERGG